jgi:hypothetical protein
VTSLETQFSVYVISELWCNNIKDFTHMDVLDGYNFIPAPRKRKGGGGVAMYIKEGIMHSDPLPIEIEKVDSLWIEIQKKASTEIVGVIYRNEDISEINFIQKLEAVLAKFQSEGKTVTICGDMNINLMKMDYTSPYVQAIKLNNFSSLITHPTHVSPRGVESCIDHIITSKTTPVNAGVIQSDICRHTATFVVYDDEMPPVPPVKKLREDFSKYNKEMFNQRLQVKLTIWRIECEMMDDPKENMGNMYGNFVDILLQTWSEFVKLKVDKLDSQLKKPWMTVALLKSIRKPISVVCEGEKEPYRHRN